jgi:hypothetical protein
VRGGIVPAPQARRLAGVLASLRCALGVAAYLAPALPAGPWIGREEGRRDGARLFARALGVRDLALGIGLLGARSRGEPLRGWAGAGALADGGDLLATLVAFRQLPRRSRWLVLAVTAGATAAGAVARSSLD